jgi:hypothetical protein
MRSDRGPNLEMGHFPGAPVLNRGSELGWAGGTLGSCWKIGGRPAESLSAQILAVDGPAAIAPLMTRVRAMFAIGCAHVRLV